MVWGQLNNTETERRANQVITTVDEYVTVEKGRISNVGNQGLCFFRCSDVGRFGSRRRQQAPAPPSDASPETTAQLLELLKAQDGVLEGAGSPSG